MEAHAENTPLDYFGEEVRTWFEETYGCPTPIQSKAWRAISEDKNVLVIAPTGSGKTLAAFLHSIDSIFARKQKCAAEGRKWEAGVRVLYISPLKALGADIERNLHVPLSAISERYSAQGCTESVTVGIRTGDTTPEERRRLQRKPPDILITTPESLYLILTSQARKILKSTETAIVDEIHSIAGTKRGSHLSLSLERLDNLTESPVRRIGLSATVRPAETVARFLGGTHPVDIVSECGKPEIDLSISVPVQDLTSIPAYSGAWGCASAAAGASKAKSATDPRNAWKSNRALDAHNRRMAAGTDMKSATPDTRVGSASIWPYLESAILDQVLSHRSTIVFVNSRGLCERLTARLNELYSLRSESMYPHTADVDAYSTQASAHGSSIRSSIGPISETVGSPTVEIARSHHGSVSKELRQSIESDLKSGRLRCVVATSSLELGIDMGSVDLVLQVAPPLSVSAGLQRAGRADHRVGGISAMTIYPKTRTEVAESASMAHAMLEGAIEETHLVENALDVLAQQTVAAVASEDGGISADMWFETVRRSADYASLPRSAFDSVILMLAGRLTGGGATSFPPRINADDAAGMLKPLPSTQRIAVSGAGTIPDRGMYPVMLDGPASSARKGRKRIGELDEEMVHESRVGDVIVLGTGIWRITEIANDRVLVQQASSKSARLPFWHGEGPGHDVEYGRLKGKFLRTLDTGVIKLPPNAAQGDGKEADTPVDIGLGSVRLTPELDRMLDSLGLDLFAKRNLAALVTGQRASTLVLPTDRNLVLECSPDDAGGLYAILHSPYGKRVHEPWALAVSVRISQKYGFDPQAQATDSGILLRMPSDEAAPSPSDFIFGEEEIAGLVTGAVPQTSLFAARFRECAARALLMGSPSPGKRTPLWQQRLRGAQLLEEAMDVEDFPIVAEAARECLMDVYDIDGLKALMGAIAAGRISIQQAHTDMLSPFAVPIVFGYVAEHIYDNDRPAADSHATLLSVDSGLLGELLGTPDIAPLLDSGVIDEMERELQRTSQEWRAHGPEGAAEILRTLGPMDIDALAKRIQPVSGDTSSYIPTMLSNLEKEHRVFETCIGGNNVWVYIGDAQHLSCLYGCPVPDWAQAFIEKDMPHSTENLPSSNADGSACDPMRSMETARMADTAVLRFARTHAVFTPKDAAKALYLPQGVIEESLEALLRAKRVQRIDSAESCNAGLSRWAEASVLKRLRTRSLAKARAEIEPVDSAAFCSFVLEYQNVIPAICYAENIPDIHMEESIEELAEVISQFEGVFLPIRMWEETVFPTRVRSYRQSLLDDLLESGDILWICRRSRKDASPECAFYPSDSPNAPYPLDLIEASFELPSDEPGMPDIPEEDPASIGAEGIKRLIAQELSLNPLSSFTSLADGIAKRMPSAPPLPQVAEALLELLWEGRVCVDSFTIARADNFDCSSLGRTPAAVGAEARRVSSRRTGARYPTSMSQAKRQARASVIKRNSSMGALSGKWFMPISPQTNPTMDAMEATESLLQRYGVVTGQIANHSGVAGGLAGLYPVLRSMEDSGMVLRGMFVEGLGGAQFADKYTVENLRRARRAADAGEKDTESPLCSTAQDIYVLPADDPANLFGSVLPWPPHIGAKPSRKSACYVVILGGNPVLFAAGNMKSITLFDSSSEDMRAALEVLIPIYGRIAKSGKSVPRKRIVVSEIGGEAVLGSKWEEILKELGLIRDTKGMRLLVDPF